MKIKDLKEWLSELPLNFDNHQLVYREIVMEENDYWAVKDIIITTNGIDKKNNKCYFTDETSYLVMQKHDYLKKKKEKI